MTLPRTHLRIEGARPSLGAVTCSCGRLGCMRWRNDALLVAAFTGPREQDVAAMAARLRVAEERPA